MTADISLRKRTSSDYIIQSEMAELVRLRFHACLKLTQGIKVFQDTILHHDKMRIAVKTLRISLTSLRLTADLKNFTFYQATLRPDYRMAVR